MNGFSPPERPRASDVALSMVVSLVVLLLPPDSFFSGMNVDWFLGLMMFPFGMLAGLLSSWLYYRHHDKAGVDPFYIRAWWTLISGLVALPVCLLLRPSVAPLAFIMLTFGAGPVAGFHVLRRIARRQG